jgi:hypothetical protein
MVMWLTVVYDRPPTLAEIKSNCGFTRNEMSELRRWMALSALANRIWLPPTAETFIDAVQPYYETEFGHGSWGPVDQILEPNVEGNLVEVIELMEESDPN